MKTNLPKSYLNLICKKILRKNFEVRYKNWIQTLLNIKRKNKI